MTYLQDSELRVLPGSHADFTELSFGQFNLTEQAKLPHPRERCILCKPGQVIAFHHNLLHSGMLNDSPDTRRFYMYISLFYTRLGLPSRNLPSLVSEAEPDHPIHAVLDRAVEERDEQVLSVFGVEGRLAARAAPVTPYDFLVSLGTAAVRHAASHVGAPVSGAFLGHLSATSGLRRIHPARRAVPLNLRHGGIRPFQSTHERRAAAGRHQDDRRGGRFSMEES